MIDYAQHITRIEFITRVVDDACLARKYKEAKDVAIEMLAETKMLVNALAHMREEQEKQEEERRVSRGICL